jgi:hypothetical protein
MAKKAQAPARKAASKPAAKSRTKPAPARKASKAAKAKTKPAASNNASTPKAESRKPRPVSKGLLLEYHLASARFSHQYVTKVFNAFPGEHLLSQAPGLPNHALWTLGHLVATNAWMVLLSTGSPSAVPPNYETMFGMGSTPHQDVTQYPSIDEVRAMYVHSHEQMIEALADLTDDQLFGPCEKDSHNFVINKLDTLVKTMWHEGWHIGQLIDLRRALNLPRGY